MLTVETTAIAGVLILTPKRHGDDRGFFSETFNHKAFAEIGLTQPFVQDNQSLSVAAGTVRGLHFQTPPAAQGKLVRALKGAILDVAVDIRRSSPTYGLHVSAELSAENGRQIWIPPGFAHAFCTLTANTEVFYKVTGYYAPQHDRGIRWNDPDLAIVWPDCMSPDTLSAKDAVLPGFADLPPWFD